MIAIVGDVNLGLTTAGGTVFPHYTCGTPIPSLQGTDVLR